MGGCEQGHLEAGLLVIPRDSCPSMAHCAPAPQPPSPPSPEELPVNVKQAYRTFAAVPGLHPPQDTPAQVCDGGPPAPAACAFGVCAQGKPASRVSEPAPSALHAWAYGLTGAAVFP